MSDDRPTSPMKAIRTHCVECMGGSTHGPKECSNPECSLYPFRLGSNPFRKKRELTEEQIEAARERAAKAREARQNA